MFLIQFKLTDMRPHYKFLFKTTISSLIMALPIFIFPNNKLGLILGLIICPIVYIVMILLKTLSHDDIMGFIGLTNKLGPFKKYSNKILDIMDKYSY